MMRTTEAATLQSASPRVSPAAADRPIRVVHLITDLDTGGAELMLARLTAASNKGWVDCAVVSLTGRGAVADQISSAGVPVFALGMRTANLAIPALWRLVALLRRYRPDVLQTWLYHADLAGLVAGTLAGVPHIVWNLRCSELDPADHSRVLSALLRLLAFLSRWPSAVVCNSKAGQRAHEQLGYRPRRWSLIPNGLDTDAFQPSPTARAELRRELNVPEGVLLVGVVGRFHPMKDHLTFLKSAATVAGMRNDVQFVLVGRGVAGNAQLLASVRDLGLADRVRLVGERRDPARVLAALDVAVSSSSYGEGFPNVVGEAMSCGTPSVATDVGDSAAIVGSAGIVVPPREPLALARGILRVLEMDESKRRLLGLSGRDRIVGEYSLPEAARRYERLYADLARPAGSVR